MLRASLLSLYHALEVLHPLLGTSAKSRARSEEPWNLMQGLRLWARSIDMSPSTVRLIFWDAWVLQHWGQSHTAAW